MWPGNRENDSRIWLGQIRWHAYDITILCDCKRCGGLHYVNSRVSHGDNRKQDWRELSDSNGNREL